MTPLPLSSNIMNRRRIVLLAIRAVATLMMVYGVVHVVRALGIAFGFAAGGSPPLQHLISTFYSNNYNPFWYGLSFAAPGMALAFMSRRIARWIVPADVNECPSCGYALQRVTTRRCPECGFTLDESPGDQRSSLPR